jgi:hypothetical protein
MQPAALQRGAGRVHLLLGLRVPGGAVYTLNAV